MIVNEYNWGTFEGNPFIIGSTDLNEYFPIYTLRHDSNYTSMLTHIVNDVYSYQKPVNKSNIQHGFQRYDDLFNVLKEYVKPEVYQFTVNEENHYLTCMKGYIADKDDNILLLLSTKNFDVYRPINKLNSEHLKLFVSTELINNLLYKNLYKKLSTEYIDFCYKNDIEVVFTTSNSIHNRVYKNNFNLKFNNLDELNSLLNSGLGNNFFQEEVTDNQET